MDKCWGKKHEIAHLYLCKQLVDAFELALLRDTFTIYSDTKKQMHGPEANIMLCKDTHMLKLRYRVVKMSNGKQHQFLLHTRQSGGAVRLYTNGTDLGPNIQQYEHYFVLLCVFITVIM